MSYPVIVIFDVGRTNKKILLFDEQYKLLLEDSVHLEESVDEDGFACEDVDALTKWIRTKFAEILAKKDIQVNAVNFSGYGASFVHLDTSGKPVTPLYNYLKPYPEKLRRQFYDTYGGESLMAKKTASPVLGSLNSGMQLYRLKYERPDLYSRISCSLHLPQYLSFVLSQKTGTDISSVGCHTGLWDFSRNTYCDWVYKEGLYERFAPLYNGDKVITTLKDHIKVGIGLHDSSAALIPYLSSFQEPFVLLSTGTWCISLNPFNHIPLNDEELQQDCLCYLSYKGEPVKASRLFAGHEHEQQIKRLASHFDKQVDFYQTVTYDSELTRKMNRGDRNILTMAFNQRDLKDFKTYEEAYHQLMLDILGLQISSTKLVLHGTKVNRIFVDGGFGKNQVYMHLMASAFPGMEVFAATIAQASALGAAMAIHPDWNKYLIPGNIIGLKYYPNTEINCSL